MASDILQTEILNRTSWIVHPKLPDSFPIGEISLYLRMYAERSVNQLIVDPLGPVLLQIGHSDFQDRFESQSLSSNDSRRAVVAEVLNRERIPCPSPVDCLRSNQHSRHVSEEILFQRMIDKLGYVDDESYLTMVSLYELVFRLVDTWEEDIRFDSDGDIGRSSDVINRLSRIIEDKGPSVHYKAETILNMFMRDTYCSDSPWAKGGSLCQIPKAQIEAARLDRKTHEMISPYLEGKTKAFRRWYRKIVGFQDDTMYHPGEIVRLRSSQAFIVPVVYIAAQILVARYDMYRFYDKVEIALSSDENSLCFDRDLEFSMDTYNTRMNRAFGVISKAVLMANIKALHEYVRPYKSRKTRKGYLRSLIGNSSRGLADLGLLPRS